MEDLRFDRPVHVLLGRGNVHHTIRTVAEAADALVNRWPKQGGNAHLAARRACLSALQGKRTAMAARKAFEKAAREDFILMEE